MQRFISFYQTLLAQVRMLIMGIYVGCLTVSCRPHTKEEKEVMRQPTEQCDGGHIQHVFTLGTYQKIGVFLRRGHEFARVVSTAFLGC